MNMTTIILLFVVLLLNQDLPRPAGWSAEHNWGWEGNGVTVLFKFFESATKKYVRCEMYQGKDQIVLAHDAVSLESLGTGPTQVKFCAKDEATFAVFLCLNSIGPVELREFSVAERKELKIPPYIFEASDTPDGLMPNGRGNAYFEPARMLKGLIRPDGIAFEWKRKPGRDLEIEMTAVEREGERWLVTMKVGKDKHVFYRADREAFWHLQMDDEKDWLAKDPVLCGSTKITIDGEEKTVQLWNQIAERQNVEQQLASYKIPDINFTWVDIVDADGSTRRIWEAPADDFTFGTVPESGFLACYIEKNRRIAFAFCDRFGPAEYYEADEKLDLPKSNVIPRTQMYIQRTDGIGSWPAIPRFGRNMIGDLAYMAFHKPDEAPRIQLLTLSRVEDRMRLEVAFQEQKVVFDLAENAPQWQQRADLLRPLDKEK